MVGLPGSGKTVVGRRLAADQDALLLSVDAWCLALTDGETEWPGPRLSDAVEALQWETAKALLQLGTNVVIDWGLWQRSQRDRVRHDAEAVGASVIIVPLDADKAELLARIQRRNLALPEDAYPVSDEEFWRWSQHWEPPDEAELAFQGGFPVWLDLTYRAP
jgi:predicted kinase